MRDCILSELDVFVDDQAVSPKLIDSCIETWAGSGS
jgi:hypothetical protein